MMNRDELWESKTQGIRCVGTYISPLQLIYSFISSHQQHIPHKRACSHNYRSLHTFHVFNTNSPNQNLRPHQGGKSENKPKTEGSFTFKAGDIRITATYSSERLIEKASADALVFARSVLAKFLFLPWAVQIQDKKIGEDEREIDCTEDNGDAPWYCSTSRIWTSGPRQTNLLTRPSIIQLFQQISISMWVSSILGWGMDSW